MTLEARLLAKRKINNSGCWIYDGFTDKQGYGRVRLSEPRRLDGVHRVAFDLWVRPLQPGEVVDHQCHNEDLACAGGPTCPHRPCFNPEHLRAGTDRSNILAGRSPIARNAAVTVCPQGHEYTEENTYRHRGRRQCVECRKVHTAKNNARRKALRQTAR